MLHSVPSSNLNCKLLGRGFCLSPLTCVYSYHFMSSWISSDIEDTIICGIFLSSQQMTSLWNSGV